MKAHTSDSHCPFLRVAEGQGSAVDESFEVTLSPCAESVQFQGLSHELRCMLNAQRCFTQVNAVWQEQLGWSPQCLVSQPWIDWVHPEDRDHSRAKFPPLPQPVKDDDEAGFQDLPIVRIHNRYRDQQGNYRSVCWLIRLNAPQKQYCIIGQLSPTVSEAYSSAHETASSRSGQIGLNSNLLKQELRHLKRLLKALQGLDEQAISIPYPTAEPKATSFTPVDFLQPQQQAGQKKLEQPTTDIADDTQQEVRHTSVLDELATQLSSKASQLAYLYQTATSVAHLPDFPISYANLFESLLDSLYPAILYDISGVLLLQEAQSIKTASHQQEDSLHLFLNELSPHRAELPDAFQEKLVETLSFMTECKLKDLPLYLHPPQEDQSGSSHLKPEENRTLDSQIMVPLLTNTDTNKKTIGLLFIAAYQAEKFTEEHIRLLYNAASHLSVSLQHLQLLWFKTEKQHLSQILNNLPTGVILLDSRHNILFSNEVANDYLEHLGVTQQDGCLLRIAERPIEELLHCNITDPNCRKVSAINSSRLVYEVLVQVLDPEEVSGDLIVVIWDVSDRKHAE